MQTQQQQKTQTQTAADLGSMLLLKLSIGRFGNRKQGELSAIETDADKKLLSLTKTLIDSPEHDAIRRFDAETVTFVRLRSVPSLFKRGVYQLRPEAVGVVDDYLESRALARKPLIDAASTQYETCVEEASRKLGSQFKRTDYPTPREYERRYYMDYSFFTVTTPNELQTLAPALFKKEREKLRATIEQAQKDAIAIVRAQWSEIVAHFVERLTDEGGKRKVFRDSIVENMQEALACFSLRNVGNDTELEEQIEKMRALASRIPNAEALRESDGFRKKMAGGFAEIKQTLDQLVTDAPLRSLDFD